jgi:hypothetical protein
LLFISVASSLAHGQQASPNFGTVPVGSSKEQLTWFYLGNDTPVYINGFVISPASGYGQNPPIDPTPNITGQWTGNGSCGGSNCFVNVTFSPKVPGIHYASWKATFGWPAYVDSVGIMHDAHEELIGGSVYGSGGDVQTDLAVTGIDVPTIHATEPFTSVVHITGVGFYTPESRSTYVILQTGRHTYYSPVKLADLAQNGSLDIPISVTFDQDEVGPQTMSAVIGANNQFSEANFNNNTFVRGVTVEPPQAQLSLALSLEKMSVYPTIEQHKVYSSPAHNPLTLVTIPAGDPGANETYVTAQLSSPVPGTPLDRKAVIFSAVTVEQSGGHNHSGNRPKGSFNPAFCITSSDGKCSVKYAASQISGEETLSATVVGQAGLQDSKTLKIEVPGLISLQENNDLFRLVGSNGVHPGNHFHSEPRIILIAGQFTKQYGALLKLNDMSLESGGLFDIGPTPTQPNNNFWQSPHLLHRLGKSFDVDHCAVSLGKNNGNDRGSCQKGEIKVKERALRTICEFWGGILIDEGGPLHCEIID